VVFWIVISCSVVAGYQRFGDSCCLHLPGEVAVAGKKGQLYRPGAQKGKGRFLKTVLLLTGVGGAQVYYCKTTRRHNPKDLDLGFVTSLLANGNTSL